VSVESLIALVAFGINDADTLIALVAALGVLVGAAAGVALRAHHESRELRRDREIKVAEELVRAVQGAITQLEAAVSPPISVEADKNDNRRADPDADAMPKIERAIYRAHVVIPRFNLIFPRVTVPSEGAPGGRETQAHVLVDGLKRLRGKLKKDAVTRKELSAEWDEFWKVHARFIRYANKAIWRRRMPRLRGS